MPGRSVLVDKTPARDPACRPTHPVPGHPDLTLKRQYPLPYSRDVGTFGNGPFDSDDARDLVDQLADQPGQRREVLDRLFFRVRDRPGLLDWESSAGEVGAAAAIVAASLPGGEDIRPQLAGFPAHRCHGPVGEGLIAAEGQGRLVDGEPARAMEWLSRSPGKGRPARDGSFPAAIRRGAETLARVGQ